MGQQTKTKGNRRKNNNKTRNANNNRNANVGNRGRNVNASMSIDRVYRERKGNKAYSSNTSAVYNQVQRCVVGPKPILRPVEPQIVDGDAAVYAHQPIKSLPGMGMVTEHRTRVTCTIGVQGFGFVLIKWDRTGPGGGVLPQGQGQLSMARVVDCLYTTSLYDSPSQAFATFQASLGVTGIAGVDTCVQSPYTTEQIVQNHVGSHMYACLGQTISLAANRSSVTSRKGQIAVKHCRTTLYPDVLSATALDSDVRADIFDAADLTETSAFKTHRPTTGCGIFTATKRTTTPYFWGGAGYITEEYPSGYTVIACSGTAGDEYVFEVDTAIAWSGTQVPLETSLCYSNSAYSEVSCARTQSTRGTSTTNDSTAQASAREAHAVMERESVQSIPEFLLSELMGAGSKMFSRAIASVL